MLTVVRPDLAYNKAGFHPLRCGSTRNDTAWYAWEPTGEVLVTPAANIEAFVTATNASCRPRCASMHTRERPTPNSAWCLSHGAVRLSVNDLLQDHLQAQHGLEHARCPYISRRWHKIIRKPGYECNTACKEENHGKYRSDVSATSNPQARSVACCVCLCTCSAAFCPPFFYFLGQCATAAA